MISKENFLETPLPQKWPSFQEKVLLITISLTIYRMKKQQNIYGEMKTELQRRKEIDVAERALGWDFVF